MMQRSQPFFMAFLISFTLCVSVKAEDSVDYTHDVKPLLKERCFACHGPLKQEAGLRLDTGAMIRQGGENGSTVNLKLIDDSLLLERVMEADESLRMPPEGDALSPEQIQTLRRWIAQGAISPKAEQPEPDPRQHWSFQQPQRPNIPEVKSDLSSTNPIDAFILQTLVRQSLTPQPTAPKHVILRRVYLDLIGLPPTQQELQAFLADDSPEAYVRVVDRLLSSPRYGERWARHWMDVWRYSDWYGRRHVPDVWNSASQMWRWRDWIVRSLNDDHGYDRMVSEMLAADEIAPADDQAGYATGYLVRNWYALNPNDWMRNTVEHTGKAFLGLTFNCAHCHDHKYDPISHDDYFRFRAFFEPIYVRQDQVPGEADPGPFQDYEYSTLRKIQRLGAVRIFDKSPEAPTWFYTGGDERNRVEERGSIPPGVPQILTDWLPPIEPVELPTVAWYPGSRPAIHAHRVSQANALIAQREQELLDTQQKLTEIPTAAKELISQAEQDYATAQKLAQQSGSPGALAGQQSLLLSALEGRRFLQNRVQQIKSLPNGTQFEYQLQILTDAHTSFQFCREVDRGLTAGYVGFDKGRILSYKPGSFTEFEVGHYDFPAGQNRFQIHLELQTANDSCLLTVESLTDGKRLSDQVPVALNGWNPVGDPSKAIMFDARTGSVAVIDAVAFTFPPTEASQAVTRLEFDFESPKYPPERDLVGLDGWENSSFSNGTATSKISTNACNQELQNAWQQLETARRALRIPELRIEVAEARVNAARSALTDIEARNAADGVRYNLENLSEPTELIQVASRREREAAVSQAHAERLAAELVLAEIEAKPKEEKDREKQIATAQKSLTTAQTTLNTANKNLQDETLTDTYTAFSPTYPRTSTGRRKTLAEWITSVRNPLTARVAVNHIWLRHFHAPLVETVYDFGLNGSEPTHPELLDWLAVELMESGWSMKHLHRLIVTSAAYRRASTSNHADQEKSIDPENNLLWKMNTGRMEVEVIRDSLLFCANKLDLTMGGQELENSESLTTFRRSLYYSTHPEDAGVSPLGELFDGPDALECYRRTESVIPQQALALTNSDLVHTVAHCIVEAWAKQHESQAEATHEQFIDAMFERILSRQPSQQEQAVCLESLQIESETPEKTADASKRRASLVRALLNHNDFIAIR